MKRLKPLRRFKSDHISTVRLNLLGESILERFHVSVIFFKIDIASTLIQIQTTQVFCQAIAILDSFRYGRASNN